MCVKGRECECEMPAVCKSDVDGSKESTSQTSRTVRLRTLCVCVWRGCDCWHPVALMVKYFWLTRKYFPSCKWFCPLSHADRQTFVFFPSCPPHSAIEVDRKERKQMSGGDAEEIDDRAGGRVREREKRYILNISAVCLASSTNLTSVGCSTKIFLAASSSSDSELKTYLTSRELSYVAGTCCLHYRTAGENCDVSRLTSRQLREIIHLFEGLFS